MAMAPLLNISDIFSVSNTLFSIGGNTVSLLETCSVLLGLVTVFLAARGKSYNYWFGYIYNISLFILFFQKSLYASMILQPIAFSIAVYGHYQWTHPKKGKENNKHELKVTLLSWSERLMYIMILIAFTLLWGFIIKYLHSSWPETFSPDPNAFLDAGGVGLILLAQFLSAKKKLDCWALWLIVDITNIILYIQAGLSFMPIVSAAYFFLAGFGFIAWRKTWKNQ
ncbi:MAG: nicotinamide riboside transporter PnuC [Bacteroidales bacterium]